MSEPDAKWSESNVRLVFWVVDGLLMTAVAGLVLLAPRPLPAVVIVAALLAAGVAAVLGVAPWLQAWGRTGGSSREELQAAVEAQFELQGRVLEALHARSEALGKVLVGLKELRQGQAVEVEAAREAIERLREELAGVEERLAGRFEDTSTGTMEMLGVRLDGLAKAQVALRESMAALTARVDALATRPAITAVPFARASPELARPVAAEAPVEAAIVLPGPPPVDTQDTLAVGKGSVASPEDVAFAPEVEAAPAAVQEDAPMEPGADGREPEPDGVEPLIGQVTPAEPEAVEAAAGDTTDAAEPAKPARRRRVAKVEPGLFDVAAPVADLERAPDGLLPGTGEIRRSAGVPGQVQLVARVNIGAGDFTYVRGSGGGLQEERGTPLRFVEIGRWEWHAEASSPVTVRLLRNDRDPAAGEPVTLVPGERVEISPVF